MTLVVAFACTDGAVIAADSMLTPGMGGLATGHHHARKVRILADHHVFAFAGDIGRAERFRILADGRTAEAATCAHALDHGLLLTKKIMEQFNDTGIESAIDLDAVLAFPHGTGISVCAFMGLLQPWLLDPDHHFVALGSGKQMADPFLRFLLDLFSPTHPSVREAVFLATWTLQHTIRTNPGGVAGPIRIVVVDRISGAFTARELSDDEIGEQEQAIADAVAKLSDWRSVIAGTARAEASSAQQPEPPPRLPRER